MENYNPDFPRELSGTAPQPRTTNLPPFRWTYRAPNPHQPLPNPNPPTTTRKRHPCTWPGCNRLLESPHNVQQHIREKHTGERPYLCDLCGDAFTRPYSMYRHREKVHGIQGERPGRGSNRAKKMLVAVGQGVAGGYAGGFEGEGVVGGAEEEPFAVNNFSAIPTACGRCGVEFENREAMLSHRHVDHDEPPSNACNCMLCLSTFGAEGETDGAGVHLAETGAVRLRGLMGDEVFPPDAGVPQQALAGAAPVQDHGQMLAAMGMTEEEFTRNMTRPVEQEGGATQGKQKRKRSAEDVDETQGEVVEKKSRLEVGVPQQQQELPEQMNEQPASSFSPAAEAERMQSMAIDLVNVSMPSEAGSEDEEQASAGADERMRAAMEEVDAWQNVSMEKVFGNEGMGVNMFGGGDAEML